MIREIEKLNLTKRQYKLIGNFLVCMSVMVLLAVFYTAELSVALSVVFIVVGLEFLVFGCVFNLTVNRINKLPEEDVLKYHCITKKNKRITFCVIVVVMIMLMFLTLSYYFVIEDTTQQESIVISEEKETEEQTTQVLYVYITENGERYHFNDNCSKGEYFQVTIDEALEKGLTPCKRCVE